MVQTDIGAGFSAGVIEGQQRHPVVAVSKVGEGNLSMEPGMHVFHCIVHVILGVF